MLIEFLQTGNGTVVVSGIQPQPVAGQLSLAADVNTIIAMLILPRDANGSPIDGIFSGEVLFQARDTTTGDTYAQLVAFVCRRYLGVSSVVNQTNLYLNQGGALATTAGTVVAEAGGDFSFKVDPNTAHACVISCMGIVLIG